MIPPNLPKTSSEDTGGSLAKVSSPQIRPSRNLTQLQHSAFSISYPENWQVSGNRQSTVTIAPQSGVGEGAIAYGVVIGGAQDPNAGSLDEATADLVQTLQRSNPGLRLSGDTQNIDVNGLPGRSVVLTGASPLHDLV